MEEKVAIKTYSENYEVHLAHLKLKEAGVESWIMNKKDSAYVPIGFYELYVREKDVEKSIDILDQD